MRISLVVAASANDVIGRAGGLPWHLPEDLRRFKAITIGKPVIMGRLTYESIGRPLPGRQNIVITRDRDYSADGCDLVRCPADALRAAGHAREVMVIGGGEIYRQFLRRAQRIYLTRVNAEVEGDILFPALNADEWESAERQSFPAGEGREYGFTFEVLNRKQVTRNR